MAYKPTSTLTAKFPFFLKLFLMIALTLLVFAGQASNSPNASVVPLSSCPGDFDGNGRVNIADFLAFASAFGTRSGDAKYNAVMDMDGSGAIDISDFLAFATEFGTTCEKTSPAVLSDREVLVALYNATDGPNWVNNENWLSDRPLGEWYGVDTDESGRVVRLVLAGHFDREVRAYVPFDLSGTLPPELGLLAELEELDLRINGLVGTIPPELGNLTNLRHLYLSDTSLRGLIPPKLGNLTNLTRLDLRGNNLTGPIPPELGGLSSLSELLLFGNELSGAIPTELGDLTSLTILDLADNRLSSSIPVRLGDLVNLATLNLGDNELAGPLPAELGDAAKLDSLDLRSNALTGPVPLLAGEPALLRVFITASYGGTGTMPGVRATFYLDGVERHSVFIAAGTQIIPSEVMEGDLALSVNAEIPASVIVPGLEMVIEVDPEGALDPVLGVTKRIPEEGRLVVDVQPVRSFHLTMIPFLSETRPDLTAVDDVSAMAADPDGHELLRDVRRLLPIAELAVVAREPVIISTPDSRRILAQVEAMRIMEGGAGYWMGVWDGRLNPGIITAPIGRAYSGGQASMSVRKASTMAHELGHNLSLGHAP